MAKIILEGMEFYSFHGCTDDEKKVGIWFSVDVVFNYYSDKAQVSDKLIDTINYQKVYEIVSKEMNTTSNLLENVAYRIKNKIISNYEDISDLSVRISKISPPLGGKIQKVSVEI